MTSPGSARLLLRAGGGGVRWSVVAANGRVLGTSLGPLADTYAAHRDFLALCPLLPDLPVTFGREQRAREWTWRIGDAESGHIAVSGQGYERHATARAAFARFVAAATELCATASRAGGPARPGQR
ncbi:hypothetical protein ACXR2U_17820 [Jatrophihabitans sp. YIM 134969]